MQLTFKIRQDSQIINLQELNTFEVIIDLPLPEDYRTHMLNHNGAMVVQEVNHINYPEGGEGISYFYPIKYGNNKMEDVFESLNGKIPSGYLAIGKTNNQGYIIISLNSGSTYGNIKEWYPDGTINDLSSSFTQLLNDMVEVEE